MAGLTQKSNYPRRTCSDCTSPLPDDWRRCSECGIVRRPISVEIGLKFLILGMSLPIIFWGPAIFYAGVTGQPEYLGLLFLLVGVATLMWVRLVDISRKRLIAEARIRNAR